MTECSSDRVFKPLAGIRVADFSWVIAGPWLTKILAYFGAEVIRVESRSRPDAIRLYHDPEHGLQLDWTARFSEFNAGKLGISLDLHRPEAQEIAKRLVAISDIVIENFSLYGMKKFGLEYDALREVNPYLIMLSVQAMGRSGPHKEYVTFGPNLLSLTGFVDLCGEPDTAPSGMGLVLPDYSNGILGAFLILSALDYRRRTGQGPYLNMSQFEALATLMQPAILAYSANQRVATRQGNRHSVYAPHNAYPCQGDERYCVIVFRTGQPTILGDLPISDVPMRLSATPGAYASAGPCIGEHNAYVYGDLLGMTDTEIATYTAQGIFN
jgi:benzylsuccinate CoA-transferase BbsF subunit